MGEVQYEGESPQARLKRMQMRSMRRGTKEMDFILMRFVECKLDSMDKQSLDAYDDLLNENDQDLYQWISGQAEPPERVAEMVYEIRAVLSDS